MDPKNQRRLERVLEDISSAEMALQFLEQSPGELNHLYIPLLKHTLRVNRKTVECVEQERPLVASYFSNAPEICAAMDIHWFTPLGQCYGVGGGESSHLMEDLEACDKLPVASDICTLLRLALYHLDAGLVPLPTALVALIEPCDGLVGLHEAMRCHREWRHIPVFAPDPPYLGGERSVNYFAHELRRMVSFLEEHTGQRLDIDRLREVTKETNKKYELWAEWSELRRASPCPHGSIWELPIFYVVQGPGCEDPNMTGWYEDLFADAEKRVREKRPEVPNQRIRFLWFDIQAVWIAHLFPWMEQEWGAIEVVDMVGYCPFTLVDTSTEETMFHDLAKRNLMDTQMVRQARGLADNFLSDITRIVKDYKIDCVIWPGHMGHKDGAASVSLMRETCRDLGVPFLHIGVDQFDRRYTTIDQMKDRISQFFSTMGWEKMSP